MPLLHMPALPHDDVPHPELHPGDGFPIEIPPIADICFSVFFSPHVGQGIATSRSPVTNSSNLFPHLAHRYSKIGI
jgi:hypothetical protein